MSFSFVILSVLFSWVKKRGKKKDKKGERKKMEKRNFSQCVIISSLVVSVVIIIIFLFSLFSLFIVANKGKRKRGRKKKQRNKSLLLPCLQSEKGITQKVGARSIWRKPSQALYSLIQSCRAQVYFILLFKLNF